MNLTGGMRAILLLAVAPLAHGFSADLPWAPLLRRGVREAIHGPCARFGDETSSPPQALGFAFSPAGLLFPYYVGVAYRLRELGWIDRHSPLGGSSAGSIVAAALACGASEGEVLGGLNSLLKEVRAGTPLNVALRTQLEQLLDEDAHIAAARQGLRVCYLEVLPRPRRHIVSEWTSRADLIETIGASCNWPLFFSRWPFVWCRGALCLDGFFAVSRDRFGCPPLDAERVVAVTALPRVTLPAFSQDNLIQPGPRFPTAPLPTADEAEWFSYAMAPADDPVVEQMVELGRTHAQLWASANGNGSTRIVTPCAPDRQD
jgi:hypothetical protein